MFILCVAPIRDIDPYKVKGKGILRGSDFDTRFSSREEAAAVMTRPRREEPIENIHAINEYASKVIPGVRVISPALYDHLGMRFLVALLDVDERHLESGDITAFEKATTSIFEFICGTTYCRCQGDHRDPDVGSEHASVRWVNRTLLITGMDSPGERKESLAEGVAPEGWFQQEGAQIVDMGPDVKFYGNWGNNLVVARHHRSVKMSHLVGPILHAQLLWCYLTDIERVSMEYLELIDAERKINNELVHGVIDLHFELAMESVMRERTKTEAQPTFRRIVEAILTAWGYDGVHADVDRRLERLEHIVQGRSELLQRSQSNVMELTLFVLGALTLVSLAISFIQTAFAEISPEGDALRPGGWLFEWTRQFDSSALVWWSLGISLIVIVVARLWPRALDQFRRRSKHAVHKKRFAPRGL